MMLASWLAWVACLIVGVHGYIRSIDEKLTKDYSSFQISDGYMYASGNGPFLFPKGSSSITVNTNIVSIWEKNATVRLNYVIYGAAEDGKEYAVRGVCSGDMKELKTNTWAKDIRLIKVNTRYSSCSPDNYCTTTAHIDSSYEIKQEGWYNVIVAVCYNDLMYPSSSSHRQLSYTNPVVTVQGSIAFKNTYGYMPAESYGILPFQAITAILYLLFVSYYFLHYFIYRASVVHVHSLFLASILFGLIESILWAVYYFYLNYSGTPSCCPFPIYYILLILFQIANQTFLRVVLLVLCLGYSIGRPRLVALEIRLIILVHAVYFLSAVASHLYYFLQLNDFYSHASLQEQAGSSHDFTSNVLNLLELYSSTISIVWIYGATYSTIRILTEFQQREKLRLYKRLFVIVNAYCALLVAVVLMFFLDYMEVLDWPWKFRWVESAVVTALELVIIASVCVLFRPTERSRLLAYAAQLPTDDPDLDLDETTHGRSLALGLDAMYFPEDDVEMVDIKPGSEALDLGGKMDRIRGMGDESSYTSGGEDHTRNGRSTDASMGGGRNGLRGASGTSLGIGWRSGSSTGYNQLPSAHDADGEYGLSDSD